MSNSYESLRYRRQFLLSNSAIPELSGWQHRQVGNGHIYAHPDLELTEREDSSSSLVLLGYIFDPSSPAKTNAEILADIHAQISGPEDPLRLLRPYTGRYAVIFHDPTRDIIVHDPYGVREIYYCTRPNKVICASQPNLIAAYSEPRIGFTRDRDILYFYSHDMRPIRSGRLWVGEETLYQGVKHLRPNHYVDIRSLTAKRYWPNKKFEKTDLNRAVELASAFLKGSLRAVTARYKTMMAVTSGFDSRSLLAASKDIHDKIYFFINKEKHLTENSPDICVPKEMLGRLKIPFHIHDVGGQVDEDFREIFLHNTFWAIELLLPTIYNVYFKHHQDKVNILGLGEIGRVYYGQAPGKLDGYYLARSLKYGSSYYATSQCEKWLREAFEVARSCEIDIMQLFLWEELIGNWGVVGNSESDIAIEEFDPYSSHYLGEILMSFDRSQGDLFMGMYNEMWPELLEHPLNPPASRKESVKQWLARRGLFVPLRRLRYRYDRWRFRRIWATPPG
jgi:hypothetical protein